MQIQVKGDKMELFTKSELAEQLKVHPNTIDRWRKKGLPCIKKGSVIRFDLNKVTSWLEENSEE